MITGANSTVGLRSMPIRFCSWTKSTSTRAMSDGEGDPVALAEKRDAHFPVRRKILLD